MPRDIKIIGPVQLDAAAELVSNMLGNPDPGAGTAYRDLLSAYYEDPHARIHINTIVSASRRSKSYRR